MSYFRSNFSQSLKSLHLVSHKGLDTMLWIFRIVCRMNLILSSSDGNYAEEQMARARWVKVRMKSVLRFCWLKELKYTLTNKKCGFPLHGDDKLGRRFFDQRVKKRKTQVKPEAASKATFTKLLTPPSAHKKNSCNSSKIEWCALKTLSQWSFFNRLRLCFFLQTAVLFSELSILTILFEHK